MTVVPPTRALTPMNQCEKANKDWGEWMDGWIHQWDPRPVVANLLIAIYRLIFTDFTVDPRKSLDSLAVVAPQISCESVVCCSHVLCPLLETELLVYRLHFLQYKSDYVLNSMSGLSGMKMCNLPVCRKQSKTRRTNEWSAFTLKRVQEVLWIPFRQEQTNIVFHRRINTENYLLPEF